MLGARLLLTASFALGAPTQLNRIIDNFSDVNTTSTSAPVEYDSLVPAFGAGAGTGNGTGTLEVGWKSGQGAGAFQDNFVKLWAGDGSTNATVLSQDGVTYGLVLKFDPATAQNQSNGGVPFIALISCDNSTSNILSNATASAATTASASASSVADAFQLAAARDASLAILYSEIDQTCTLDADYSSSNLSKPLAIWASPSLQTSQMLLQQFNHIDSSMFSYNSSLLASLATNLTAAIAAKSVAAVELLGFLAGSFTPANATTNGTSSSSGSGGPVLVSIAPAPSKTASASPVATGSSTSATGRVGVDGGLVGMAVTVVVVWVGLVVFA